MSDMPPPISQKGPSSSGGQSEFIVEPTSEEMEMNPTESILAMSERKLRRHIGKNRTVFYNMFQRLIPANADVGVFLKALNISLENVRRTNHKFRLNVLALVADEHSASYNDLLQVLYKYKRREFKMTTTVATLLARPKMVAARRVEGEDTYIDWSQKVFPIEYNALCQEREHIAKQLILMRQAQNKKLDIDDENDGGAIGGGTSPKRRREEPGIDDGTGQGSKIDYGDLPTLIDSFNAAVKALHSLPQEAGDDMRQTLNNVIAHTKQRMEVLIGTARNEGEEDEV